MSWPVRCITDCVHNACDRHQCDRDDCVAACRKCRGLPWPHEHCAGCGSMVCHGWWWRPVHPNAWYLNRARHQFTTVVTATTSSGQPAQITSVGCGPALHWDVWVDADGNVTERLDVGP